MLTCILLFQLLNLLAVIIDSAESNLPDKSRACAKEQTAAEIPEADARKNSATQIISSGVSVSLPSAVDPSRSISSGTNDECDVQSVLLNLPQAELRLLCSLLAREGYDIETLSTTLLTVCMLAWIPYATVPFLIISVN